MRRVVIESPYSGDVDRNTKYAREAMLDCLRKGEAPIASHLLYTQVLDDATPAERKQGMEAGFAWNEMADEVYVYADYGISRGMYEGIQRALGLGIPVTVRLLYKSFD